MTTNQVQFNSNVNSNSSLDVLGHEYHETQSRGLVYQGDISYKPILEDDASLSIALNQATDAQAEQAFGYAERADKAYLRDELVSVRQALGTEPYLRVKFVTKDGGIFVKKSFEKAMLVLGMGRISFDPSECPLLAAKGGCNRMWYVAGMLPQNDGITFFVTRTRGLDLRAALHLEATSDKLETVWKRDRRSNANAQLRLEGTVLEITDGHRYTDLGGSLEAPVAIPVRIAKVAFDQVHHYAKEIPVKATWIAYVALLTGTDPATKAIQAIFDGGHLGSREGLNTGLDIFRISKKMFPRMPEKGGAQVTGMGKEFAHLKGNMCFIYLQDVDFLFIDQKTQLRRTDDRFVLSLNVIKQPGAVMHDRQSHTVGHMGKLDVLRSEGTPWIMSIPNILSQENACELLADKMGLDETPVVNPEMDPDTDRFDEDRSQVEKANEFVLAKFIRLCNRLQMRGEGGEVIDIRQFPAVMRQLERTLLSEFQHVSKLRVPYRRDEAAAGYIFPDVTVLHHLHPDYAGRGFYFSNTVLPQNTLAMMHRTEDEFGRLNAASTPIEGDILLHRQPSGWEGEWVPTRGVAVREYEYDNRTPFIFVSIRPIEITDEQYAYLWQLLPEKELNDLYAYWGGSIPTSALYLALMGFGDCDDRAIALFGSIGKQLLAAHTERVLAYPRAILPDAKQAGSASTTMPEQAKTAFTRMAMYRQKHQQQSQSPVRSALLRALEDNTIGRVAKAAFLFDELDAAGFLDKTDPAVIATTSLFRGMDKVIDRVKMGKGEDGLDLAGYVNQTLKNFWMYVQTLGSVPAWLLSAVPKTMLTKMAEAGKPMESFVTETDLQLKELGEMVKLTRSTIYDTFIKRNPDTEYRVGFLMNYEVSAFAQEWAQYLRQSWKFGLQEERVRAEAEIEAILSRLSLSDDERDEKLELHLQKAMATESKRLDAELTQQLLTLGDVAFAQEVSIALYQMIIDHKASYDIVLADGTVNKEYYEISDAQLWKPVMGNLFLDAIEMSYTRYNA